MAFIVCMSNPERKREREREGERERGEGRKGEREKERPRDRERESERATDRRLKADSKRLARESLGALRATFRATLQPTHTPCSGNAHVGAEGYVYIYIIASVYTYIHLYLAVYGCRVSHQHYPPMYIGVWGSARMSIKPHLYLKPELKTSLVP